ncbi:sulfatase family protein [Tundrisphaera sp. TA3]|uniref:sulfatase family protein n=1 Tax=Tundrisphaera sp. TA3 TaxID=3435775 RepID=UPI003EB9F98E
MIRRAVMIAALGVLAASTTRAADAPRPNILLVIADDWSFGHAGAYGCRWIRTPNFDRVAREGVLFSNAFTNNPKCSPCRASLLTGRNTWQLDEAMCHNGLFPARWPVYPDLLEAAGYHVGFTGKGWGPGDFKAGGFRRNPAGPAYQQAKQAPPLRGMANTDLAGNFSAFLDARKPGQPFCFWVGGQEPHRPYEDGSGRRAGRDPASVVLPSYYPDSPIIRDDLLDYAMEVERFDAQLGRVLERLERTGELDNTLVLITSDHGMPFPRVKGQIYEAGFHIPLAVRWGRNKGMGRLVEDFINVRDIAPTFLAAAGCEAPASVTGKSFLDVLKSEASGRIDPARDRMVIGKERHDLGRPDDQGYPVRAIRTPDYLYVVNYEPDRWPVGNPETGYPNCDDGPTKTLITSRFDESYRLCFGKRPAEELYRIRKDPDCVANLAGDPALLDLRRQLRAEMEALLRSDGDPRMFGRGGVFEAYRYLGPRGHAYDEWLKFSRPAR